MPFSIRLDPDTEARIRQLAAATGRSKATVLREAVTRYAADWEREEAAPATALDRLRPYIGVVDSGGAQYSRNTHEKYRDALVQERRAQRPRGRQRAHRTAR
jgi:predicted DNA-binding protein